jgi:hypothetical protein
MSKAKISSRWGSQNSQSARLLTSRKFNKQIEEGVEVESSFQMRREKYPYQRTSSQRAYTDQSTQTIVEMSTQIKEEEGSAVFIKVMPT